MEGKRVKENLDNAKKLAENGDYESAIDLYLSIVESDVDNATAWYCLGVIYHNNEQLELSLEAFQNSNEIFPNHEPTIANLNAINALISEDQGDPKEMDYDSQGADTRVFIESFQLGDHTPEENDEDRILAAKGLSESGKHSAAVEMWRGMIEKTPESPEIWRGLADALFSAGYPEKAEKCRTKADQLDMKENFDLIDEGVVELEDDEFVVLANEAALEEADSSVANSVGDVNEAIRWYNMGLNLTNEGNTDEALTCFDKAIGAAPRDEVEIKVKAHCGRGNALYGASRFSDSIIAYHTAIQLSPESATGRVLYNMGSSYACLEMYDDAVKCFTQSLERGLEKEEHEVCRKQISRCRLLSREQAKRQSRVMR